MELEVKTFPIDIMITVHDCDELDAVWRMKNIIARKEVEKTFRELREFEKSQKKPEKKTHRAKMISSDQWLRNKDMNELMRAMGQFTRMDLCNALHLTRTKRNLYRCGNHIARAIREGRVESTHRRRKSDGSKRLSKVYSWKF